MTDTDTDTQGYWCDSASESKDADEIAERVESLTAETPRELSRDCVDSGFVDDVDEYYDLLHEVCLKLARREVESRLGAVDADLVNAVRSLETTEEALNEIDERIRDWESGSAGEDPEILHEFRETAEDLRETAEELREFIETEAWEVAPNLSNLAGPFLAARLISLAGGLEDLARKPSSTLQVLGAEDALFRHLQSGTPPPKHGVIFTHPYVRNTSPDERGSASRALAGKLTIAARVDYYSDSGDLRESLAEELDEKIERIRQR
ncbi:MAG: NOP5/NOP56 family protein [Halobacteria archaeon]|nr:NOP5/NOP56 family protein [Halobacteria archaeon]